LKRRREHRLIMDKSGAERPRNFDFLDINSLENVLKTLVFKREVWKFLSGSGSLQMFHPDPDPDPENIRILRIRIRVPVSSLIIPIFRVQKKVTGL